VGKGAAREGVDLDDLDRDRGSRLNRLCLIEGKLDLSC
jgi:hypothetical protein